MVAQTKGRESPVVFRNRAAQAELERRLRPGQGLGARVSVDLLRYYALCAAELREIGLLPAEAVLVAEALAGLDLEAPNLRRLLWALTAEALEAGRGAEVDGPALLERLRSLSPGQAFALVDAVERAEVLTGQGRDLRDALGEVGLLP